MRYTLVLIAMVVVTGCGGSSSGNSPTSPSSSTPTVNGNYTGSVTVVYPEIPATLVCPASTAVTQSGRSINMAPMVLGGQCGGISIPFGSMTIDNNGAIDGGATSGTFNEPSCGTYTGVASGGFFGRELRISMNATSRTCWNFNFTATLTR